MRRLNAARSAEASGARRTPSTSDVVFEVPARASMKRISEAGSGCSNQSKIASWCEVHSRGRGAGGGGSGAAASGPAGDVSTSGAGAAACSAASFAWTLQ